MPTKGMIVSLLLLSAALAGCAYDSGYDGQYHRQWNNDNWSNNNNHNYNRDYWRNNDNNNYYYYRHG